MKVTLNWLKKYVDFDWSPEELAERLTMLGIEVEAVRKLRGEFAGIVVGQILTKDKVPGSDKLSVCKVNDGTGERTIICGAQNHQVGDKVPVILPNFALPLKPGEKEPFVIKQRKVFGITSQGMMCSPQELGLPDPVEGLLILPPEARVGQPFAEYLGRPAGDVLYDLEITPNRPDLNSLIGIAREIAAVTGNALKIPAIELKETGAPAAEQVAVRIDDAELCPRYTARVVRGVKIGPSPDWLKQSLEKVGVRSISNVVDVTNFVMLETGQPLHAFDYHLIARGADGKPTIVIRRAAAAEKFTTLDGQARNLTDAMLLIADEQKGIALAGVMGGQNSEIHDATVDVIIESAYFKPQNIRAHVQATRPAHGGVLSVRTWSGHWDLRLRKPAGGAIDPRNRGRRAGSWPGGRVSQACAAARDYPAPSQSERTARSRTASGEDGILSGPARLEDAGRKPRPVDAEGPLEPVTFRIPTFRVDLKREVDLIEEIARLHGVEKIPSTPPRGATGSNEFDAIFDQLAEVRGILTGLGFDEAQGQTLVANGKCQAQPGEFIALANPLSSDMDALRPSLLPGLLDALQHNANRKNPDVALFEIGRVFAPGQGALREERRLALAMTGLRSVPFWSGNERDAKSDIFDLKGAVEGLLEQLGLRGANYLRPTHSSALFLESATIHLGKNTLGELGQLSPALARAHDLRDAVLLAELNLDLLLPLARRSASSHRFKPTPTFPAIRRDVAMLLPDATLHAQILNVIKAAKPENLESVELFDIFRGKNVPEGQKSMAYAFTYRSPERTLTDAEVQATHEKVVEQLKRELPVTVREA